MKDDDEEQAMPFLPWVSLSELAWFFSSHPTLLSDDIQHSMFPLKTIALPHQYSYGNVEDSDDAAVGGGDGENEILLTTTTTATPPSKPSFSKSPVVTFLPEQTFSSPFAFSYSPLSVCEILPARNFDTLLLRNKDGSIIDSFLIGQHEDLHQMHSFSVFSDVHNMAAQSLDGFLMSSSASPSSSVSSDGIASETGRIYGTLLPISNLTTRFCIPTDQECAIVSRAVFVILCDFCKHLLLNHDSYACGGRKRHFVPFYTILVVFDRTIHILAFWKCFSSFLSPSLSSPCSSDLSLLSEALNSELDFCIACADVHTAADLFPNSQTMLIPSFCLLSVSENCLPKKRNSPCSCSCIKICRGPNTMVFRSSAVVVGSGGGSSSLGHVRDDDHPPISLFAYSRDFVILASCVCHVLWSKSQSLFAAAMFVAYQLECCRLFSGKREFTKTVDLFLYFLDKLQHLKEKDYSCTIEKDLNNLVMAGNNLFKYGRDMTKKWQTHKSLQAEALFFRSLLYPDQTADYVLKNQGRQQTLFFVDGLETSHSGMGKQDQPEGARLPSTCLCSFGLPALSETSSCEPGKEYYLTTTTTRTSIVYCLKSRSCPRQWRKLIFLRFATMNNLFRLCKGIFIPYLYSSSVEDGKLIYCTEYVTDGIPLSEFGRLFALQQSESFSVYKSVILKRLHDFSTALQIYIRSVVDDGDEETRIWMETVCREGCLFLERNVLVRFSQNPFDAQLFVLSV